MIAAIRRKYGPPAVITVENINTPVPGDHEVLVKVNTTTVNRTDCANLTGKPFIMHLVLGFFRPRQVIMGTDFAGKVVATGKNVTGFSVDENVFGFKDTGLASQAEYVSVPEEDLLSMPGNITHRQAAASLEGAHYAYTFIHKVSIQAGQKVFINGASGAIGSALLQFVKQYDVEIDASCGPQAVDWVKSLGVQQVFDHTKEDFTKSAKKYDYIFDAVGKSRFGICKPLLNTQGVYISSELGPYSENIFYALFTRFTGGKKVYFPVPYSRKKTMPYIIDLLKRGLFVPVIDRSFPIKDIAGAYTYVMKGGKTGNVVISMDN